MVCIREPPEIYDFINVLLLHYIRFDLLSGIKDLFSKFPINPLRVYKRQSPLNFSLQNNKTEFIKYFLGFEYLDEWGRAVPTTAIVNQRSGPTLLNSLELSLNNGNYGVAGYLLELGATSRYFRNNNKNLISIISCK